MTYEEGERQRTKLYAIAHPVRTRYAEMLELQSTIDEFTGYLYNGIGGPGDGRNYVINLETTAIKLNSVQAEIAGGYFKPEDFKAVYPQYTQETLHQSIKMEYLGMGRDKFIDQLNVRATVIKRVCEENNWFEKKEDYRPGAKDYPRGKEARDELAGTEWDSPDA